MTYEHTKSREEVAKHFGLSLRTIDRMISGRRIPHIKIGRRRLFSIEEVEAYFAAQHAVPTRRAA